jgi:hypothetical protein
MANKNTQLRRNNKHMGYGKKRGFALKTGLGQEHGSPTRKNAWNPLNIPEKMLNQNLNKQQEKRVA